MKTSRRFSLALAIGLGLLAEGLRAGGTLEIAQVETLLAEQPATYQWLRATLQFPDTAWAEVRLGRQFAHLGGHRLAPYSFQASRQESASAVEEHLDSVIVRDRPTETRIPRCP